MGCNNGIKSEMDNPAFSKTLIDDDILKVELLGYGINSENIDDLVVEIYYKGMLVDDAPFDDLILEILNSITGEKKQGMKVTAKLFALDKTGNYELKYVDWYQYIVFWMNSKNAQALKNYGSQHPNALETDSGNVGSAYEVFQQQQNIKNPNVGTYDTNKENADETIIEQESIWGEMDEQGNLVDPEGNIIMSAEDLAQQEN